MINPKIQLTFDIFKREGFIKQNKIIVLCMHLKIAIHLIIFAIVNIHIFYFETFTKIVYDMYDSQVKLNASAFINEDQIGVRCDNVQGKYF